MSRGLGDVYKRQQSGHIQKDLESCIVPVFSLSSFIHHICYVRVLAEEVTECSCLRGETLVYTSCYSSINSRGNIESWELLSE